MPLRKSIIEQNCHPIKQLKIEQVDRNNLPAMFYIEAIRNPKFDLSFVMMSIITLPRVDEITLTVPIPRTSTNTRWSDRSQRGFNSTKNGR